MNSIIDFITENDVILMTGLLLLIVILTIIVLITDSINKKKNSKDAVELFTNSDFDMTSAFNEKIDNSDNLEYTADLKQYDSELNINNDNEIKYVVEDEELEKTKAQLELKALKEELIKAEMVEQEINLEKNIEKSPTEIIDLNEISSAVDKYENDQEKNAIISIEEFNKVSDKIYDENEIVQYQDDGNEPISIKELEELYNTKELKTIPSTEEITQKSKKDIVEESNKDYYSKFKSTPVISPVYGLDSENKRNSFNLEDTGNYDKLSEEIRKTNEFLNTLRELRKNLQ